MNYYPLAPFKNECIQYDEYNSIQKILEQEI